MKRVLARCANCGKSTRYCASKGCKPSPVSPVPEPSTVSEYRGKYADIPMPIGCLYLNNDGSRWVTQDMRFVLVAPDGTRTVRIAEYFSSLGNFGTIGYRVKGKRFERYPKAHDGSDVRDDMATGINALPHIFHTF